MPSLSPSSSQPPAPALSSPQLHRRHGARRVPDHREGEGRVHQCDLPLDQGQAAHPLRGAPRRAAPRRAGRCDTARPSHYWPRPGLAAAPQRWDLAALGMARARHATSHTLTHAHTTPPPAPHPPASLRSRPWPCSWRTPAARRPATASPSAAWTCPSRPTTSARRSATAPSARSAASRSTSTVSRHPGPRGLGPGGRREAPGGWREASGVGVWGGAGFQGGARRAAVHDVGAPHARAPGARVLAPCLLAAYMPTHPSDPPRAPRPAGNSPRFSEVTA
jgi:hypothetical protein